MMQQPDLFTYAQKLPRRRQRDTSAQAEKKIERHVTPLRDKVLAFVKKQGADGATPDEAAIGLNIDLLNIRPRFTELNQMGLIAITKERRTNRKGNTVRVWVSNA